MNTSIFNKKRKTLTSTFSNGPALNFASQYDEKEFEENASPTIIADLMRNMICFEKLKFVIPKRAR